MTTFEVKLIGIDSVRIDLQRLSALISRSNIVTEIANDIRDMVVERTFKGISAELSRFKRYSTQPIYIPLSRRPVPRGGRRRSLNGKPMKTAFYPGGYAQYARETKGSASPNLFATGDMFRAFQVQSKSSRGHRAFILFTRKFPALKAMANNAERAFVGVNEAKELPIIEKNFANKLAKLIRQAGF